MEQIVVAMQRQSVVLLLQQPDLMPKLVPPERVLVLLSTCKRARAALIGLQDCEEQQSAQPGGLHVILECTREDKRRHWLQVARGANIASDFLRFRSAQVELRVSSVGQLKILCEGMAKALSLGWSGLHVLKLLFLEPLTPPSRRIYRVLFQQHQTLAGMRCHRQTAGSGWVESLSEDDDSPFFARVQADQVQELGNVLKRMPNLVSLDLAGGFMGDAGMEKLGGILSACDTQKRGDGGTMRLRRLNVCLNNLSNRFCCFRACCLSLSCFLQIVHYVAIAAIDVAIASAAYTLTRAYVHEHRGFAAVSATLKCFGALEELDVGGNLVTDEALRALGRSLAQLSYVPLR